MKETDNLHEHINQLEAADCISQETAQELRSSVNGIEARLELAWEEY